MVHIQLDAEVAQRMEESARRLDIFREHILGDLEGQPGRFQLGVLEHGPHLAHETRVCELFAGEIHADPEGGRGGVPVLPAARVPARLLEHPGADREDEAGPLRERQEVCRNDHIPLGAVPA